MAGLRAVVIFPVNGNKDEHLRNFAKKVGAKLTIAIGDGANDVPMLKEADIGIGFCPKPAAAKAADYIVTERDMRHVLNVIKRGENNVRHKIVQRKP